MTETDEFELRLGRPRAAGQSTLGQVLAATARAGGLVPRKGMRASTFGRGRAAALAAAAGPARRRRGAVIKARVVRRTPFGAPLALHLTYLQREGVRRDSERGELFAATEETADGAAFAARCAEDRHHFRFIVSPDDAERLSDLRAFTRDLMRQAERDLGTELDWVAADHWNTGHPHVHVIVRGRDDQGRDLVISRDYIAEGLRARAAELVTLELGPRSDQEIARQLDREAAAERWTRLDARLVRDQVRQGGELDLRPGAAGSAEPERSAKLRRLQKLQAMGLAQQGRPGRWRIDPGAEPALRELGRRGDIIARLHRAMGEGVERDAASLVLAGGPGVVGRLVARGHDDELRGTGYAVIDGLDGRLHHVGLRDLADASDAPPGAVVEARAVGTAGRTVLTVRSDLDLDAQVAAGGATWLDRQLVGRDRASRAATGFARAVDAALAARTEHLVAEGLARRVEGQVRFTRNLLAELARRDLKAAAGRVSAETGLEAQDLEPGAPISGRFTRRLDLASGRFAVIEGALGFALVPWRADLEPHRGREVIGALTPSGGVDWRLGRDRGPQV